MKSLFCAVLFFIQFNSIAQQTRYTISGFVREAVSGESLIGVNIYLPDHKAGTVTNTYGFYSLTLPEADAVEITFSYVGYTPEVIRTSLKKDMELNVDLKPGLVLSEVTVNAERQERQSESVKMSTVNLQPAQIKNVPSLLGEKDVLKVLQLMPGVQKGTEGSSGLYVRGGAPDQNLIILDDAVVYNVSHLFGFFSLFNGDAIKSVELTKGGFPARYGGRLSSILEMNMKDGNREVWKTEGGIGLISSRLTVEGPLSKGKSSILVSGRRTYADILMKPILHAMGEENMGYYFYDLNAKLNYDIGRNNRIYLSGYFGRDKFHLVRKDNYISEDIGFHWGNATGTLRWNHLFNNRVFSNTSLVYSGYNFGISDEYEKYGKETYFAEYKSGIRDLSVKYDLDFIHSPVHWIRTGGQMIFHRFKPHAYIEIDAEDDFNTRDVRVIEGVESGIYAEDTWQPATAVKINAGLRFSHFLATKNRYYYLEPRLSAALRCSDDFAVKGSYALMNQYIHMVSGTGINLPTDLWVPTTDKVKPQQSSQVAFGIVKDLREPELFVSVEGYYKIMKNIIGYREGSSFLQLDEANSGVSVDWEDNVTPGKAWSYGVEVLLQRKVGRLTGWLGYTLSWTQMQFDSLNFGRKFWARYDRRHDLSITGTYNISKRITLSGSWVYGTGNAVTLPISEYSATFHESYVIPAEFDPPERYGAIVNEYSGKNNFRMKPYHRLDIGIQFHKEKKWGERIWEISLYNAYSRQNPFYYYTLSDWNKEKQKFEGNLVQVSLFPVIPSITYSFKF